MLSPYKFYELWINRPDVDGFDGSMRGVDEAGTHMALPRHSMAEHDALGPHTGFIPGLFDGTLEVLTELEGFGHSVMVVLG